jgi:hypothetical protein
LRPIVINNGRGSASTLRGAANKREAAGGLKSDEPAQTALEWEIWSEYTFDCRIGRTLEKTGSSTLEIKPDLWRRMVENLLPRLREQIGPLRDLDQATLGRFLAGLVQHLKNKGGVDENDLAPYIEGLGNTWMLGKQGGRAVWRPNFSRASRSPVFLTSRGGERFQTLVRQPNNPTPTWYEDWLEKSFHGLDPAVANSSQAIYEWVLSGLKETGLIFEGNVRGARVWGLQPAAFQVTTEVVQFRCKYCSFAVSVGKADVAGSRHARFQSTKASRIGRGTRLNRDAKKRIWPVFQEYRAQLNEQGKKEYIDLLRDARGLIQTKGISLPYRALIVDEAQDMSGEAFRLLRAIVPEAPNDLFIVGDAHQRIYRHRVALGQCGINIRGRGKKLKINYRTTDEIRRAAVSLLEGREIDDLDGGTPSCRQPVSPPTKSNAMRLSGGQTGRAIGDHAPGERP